MYHRNKVHTDEFWKYELAKHRRVGFDYAVNEDMWKKQLGRHAEAVARKNFSLDEHTAPISEAGRINLANEDKWLDQIQRSTSKTSYQRSQVASEMKLLALQSLQSSLNFMNADVLARTRMEDRHESILKLGSSSSRTAPDQVIEQQWQPRYLSTTQISIAISMPVSNAPGYQGRTRCQTNANVAGPIGKISATLVVPRGIRQES